MSLGARVSSKRVVRTNERVDRFNVFCALISLSFYLLCSDYSSNSTDSSIHSKLNSVQISVTATRYANIVIAIDKKKRFLLDARVKYKPVSGFDHLLHFNHGWRQKDRA